MSQPINYLFINILYYSFELNYKTYFHSFKYFIEVST